MSTESHELVLYADNTYALYQQQKPFVDNMRKKMRAGKYFPLCGTI